MLKQLHSATVGSSPAPYSAATLPLRVLHNSGMMLANKAATSMEVEGAAPSIAKPNFKPLTAHEVSDGQVQFRKISVPKHRYTPLKKSWMDIYTPIYDQMKVDIRMNVKTRNVELMTRRNTPDVNNLQKSADFVHAFMLGFDVIDAVALLRMDELYVDSFEIKDVKTLKGEHLSRAIGRLSGKGGKVYSKLRAVTSRLAERRSTASGARKPNEAAFKAACPIVKPAFLRPTRGETPVRSTQACFPPIYPKTKISAGLRVDLPSNGSVRKLTGASFLADIPGHLNTSKRKSLTMSCRYLKPGRSLQCTACSPNESKHALRQTGHNSSTGNSGIKMRYLRMTRYSTGDICWPRPSMGRARRKS
ncbi:hypothetical protein LXL04_001333 [Taraxacum kok-saghyz]